MRAERAPGRRPWARPAAGGPLVELRAGGGLPLRSWLALWAALAADDPRRALEHMLLLGYAGEPGALLAPSRPRRAERGLPAGPARSLFQARRLTPTLSLSWARLLKCTLLLFLARARPWCGCPSAATGCRACAGGADRARPGRAQSSAVLRAQVLVFGAGGAGKSELLQALAGSRLPAGAAAAPLTALAQVERERDRARPRAPPRPQPTYPMLQSKIAAGRGLLRVIELQRCRSGACA